MSENIRRFLVHISLASKMVVSIGKKEYKVTFNLYKPCSKCGGEH